MHLNIPSNYSPFFHFSITRVIYFIGMSVIITLSYPCSCIISFLGYISSELKPDLHLYNYTKAYMIIDFISSNKSPFFHCSITRDIYFVGMSVIITLSYPCSCIVSFLCYLSSELKPDLHFIQRRTWLLISPILIIALSSIVPSAEIFISLECQS